MQDNWQPLVGFLISSGIGGWAIRELLSIKQQLAVIAIKLEHIHENTQVILRHDRKITAMEQMVYGPLSSAKKTRRGEP